MEATSKINVTQRQENLLIALFNQQADIFESARFGWMSFYITIQSCWGAIAAAFILQNNADIWMLCACAAVSMASNAVFIAQGDKKLCLAILYLSLITNAFFIFTNL